MLYEDLDESNEGGDVKKVQEGEDMCVYIQLIHFMVEQKLIQHCKATISQLKIKRYVLFQTKYLQ